MKGCGKWKEEAVAYFKEWHELFRERERETEMRNVRLQS
jgi:hypothetical protein